VIGELLELPPNGDVFGIRGGEPNERFGSGSVLSVVLATGGESLALFVAVDP